MCLSRLLSYLLLYRIFERAWRRGSVGTVKTTDTRPVAPEELVLSTSPPTIETLPLIPSQSGFGIAAKPKDYGAA